MRTRKNRSIRAEITRVWRDYGRRIGVSLGIDGRSRKGQPVPVPIPIRVRGRYD